MTARPARNLRVAQGQAGGGPHHHLVVIRLSLGLLARLGSHVLGQCKGEGLDPFGKLLHAETGPLESQDLLHQTGGCDGTSFGGPEGSGLGQDCLLQGLVVLLSSACEVLPKSWEIVLVSYLAECFQGVGDIGPKELRNGGRGLRLLGPAFCVLSCKSLLVHKVVQLGFHFSAGRGGGNECLAW